MLGADFGPVLEHCSGGRGRPPGRPALALLHTIAAHHQDQVQAPFAPERELRLSAV